MFLDKVSQGYRVKRKAYRLFSGVWVTAALLGGQTGPGVLAAGGGDDRGTVRDASEGACAAAGTRHVGTRHVTRRFSEMTLSAEDAGAGAAAEEAARPAKRAKANEDGADEASGASAASVNPETITTFSLGRQGLDAVPGYVCTFTSLTELNLASNQFHALPRAIGALTLLRKLNLCFNRLADLPPEFSSLRALQTLNVGSNEFTHVPAALAGMTSLRTLDLASNPIAFLPGDSPLWTLTELTELLLDECALEEIPAELRLLTQLRTLGVTGNQLIALPADIRELHNLYELRINANVLHMFPPALGQLSNLGELYAQGGKDPDMWHTGQLIAPSNCTVHLNGDEVDCLGFRVIVGENGDVTSPLFYTNPFSPPFEVFLGENSAAAFALLARYGFDWGWFTGPESLDEEDPGGGDLRMQLQVQGTDRYYPGTFAFAISSERVRIVYAQQVLGEVLAVGGQPGGAGAAAAAVQHMP